MCALFDKKKAGVVVHAGKFNYTVVMTVTGTTVRLAHDREATAPELVVEMHKQVCISGGRNEDADDEDKVKEMTLGANSDIKFYHCGQKGHKKRTVQSYNINLGAIRVTKRARERKIKGQL